jgi:hypothetical protein
MVAGRIGCVCWTLSICCFCYHPEYEMPFMIAHCRRRCCQHTQSTTTQTSFPQPLPSTFTSSTTRVTSVHGPCRLPNRDGQDVFVSARNLPKRLAAALVSRYVRAQPLEEMRESVASWDPSTARAHKLTMDGPNLRVFGTFNMELENLG